MIIKRVAVGISGGVDSAVCAHLLQSQGFEVVGVYMQNWEADNDDPYCTASQDLADARLVCQHLGIEFHTVNFAKEYWDNVFQYCLDEFALGRTPNPDIWCNKEIKFKVFLQHVKQLGVDYLATGHYAKIRQNEHRKFELCKADDLNKDQTYFLYTLGQNELSQALFPLAEYSKPDIRKIAEKIQLPNATKKDSTGICFIGERRFKTFLQEFILAKPGDIVSTDGKLLGRHDGVIYYTLGQRKGLHIGGVKGEEDTAWYVVDKNLNNNQLIISAGDNHPQLLSSALTCDDAHWVVAEPDFPLHCSAKTRYRQADQLCVVTKISASDYRVEFSEQQRAVTPGQSVVFYQGDRCLGGATIKRRIS
jgi:tRNA-uridine 2-sulfurtransferase